MKNKTLLLGLIAAVSMTLPAGASALYLDPYQAQAGGGFPFQYNSRHAQDAIEYQNHVYDQRYNWTTSAASSSSLSRVPRTFDGDYGNAPGPVWRSSSSSSAIYWTGRTTPPPPSPPYYEEEHGDTFVHDVDPTQHPPRSYGSPYGEPRPIFRPHPAATNYEPSTPVLPQTGPETLILGGATLLAAGWTLWSARAKKEKGIA